MPSLEHWYVRHEQNPMIIGNCLMSTQKKKSKKAIRPETGSGIVEGVVGLMLIVSATVIAVMLLLNTGIATYNKEKLSFVADQAAIYATSVADSPTRDSDVSSFVNNMFSNMGIQASNTTVTVKDIACSKWAAIQVQVTTSLPI